MGASKRRVGRPVSRLTLLGRWLRDKGWSRDVLAEKLKISRQTVDRLCRGARRPGLDLALRIEKLTDTAVPVASWSSVPAHSKD